jgi:hypothetical protein
LKFARIVFSVAAAYGFLVLTPLYFLLDKLGQAAPPAVNHPEFYYGFVGLALVWQPVFVLIATNPMRYRPIMPIAIFEKFVYTVPVLILYSQGKLAANVLGPSLVDPIFGLLFLAAYLRTSKPHLT